MLYGTYIYIERLYLLEIDAQNIPLPKWILSSILPFGFFLLLLRLLQLAKQIYVGEKETLGMANEQVTLTGTEK
jgi:C4-dicarboxylate transporter DctQ subunit